MPIANFEELCKGLCEVAGFPPPRLEPDVNGQLAFSLRLRGIVVSVLESRRGAAETAVLIAEFGPLPPAEALSGWLALLDANMFLMDVDAPRFCREPDSGDVVLQWTCPVGEVTVSQVYERVSRMVDMAQLWRRNHFLGHHDTPPAPWDAPLRTAEAVDSVAAEAGAARFRQLHADIGEALGQPPEPLQFDEGNASFVVRMQMNGLAIDATVGHCATQRPRTAFVALRFPPASAEDVLDQAMVLLTANFTLMMDVHGATFCRDPWTGELALMYACPLEAVQARQLLADLGALAKLIAAWRSAAQLQ